MAKRLLDVPLKRELGEPQVIPGMAYFPKTGPLGAVCGECRFIAAQKKGLICRKWAELMQSKKPGPHIADYFWACKYFEPKRQP